MQYRCREDTVKSRFSSKYSVDEKTGCWNWTASVRDNGYGQMQTHRKVERAHRVAWEIHRGEIPAGMFVLHRCDNRLCVNPDHLYLGTHDDNMKDMDDRGRTAMADRHYRTKLSCEDALEIRNMYDSGCWSSSEIAALFSVTRSVVNKIGRRTTWASIGPDGKRVNS